MTSRRLRVVEVDRETEELESAAGPAVVESEDRLDDESCDDVVSDSAAAAAAEEEEDDGGGRRGSGVGESGGPWR